MPKKAELENMIKYNEEKGTRVRCPPARVLDSASSDQEFHKTQPKILKRSQSLSKA